MRQLHVAISLLLLAFWAIQAEPEAQAFSANPAQLTFNAMQGGMNPPSQIVSFEKHNKRDINRASAYDASWLSVTLSPRQYVPSDQLLVSVNVAGLSPGVYRGTVTIAATKDDSVTIAVTLRIAARPTVTISSSPPSIATVTPISDADSETDVPEYTVSRDTASTDFAVTGEFRVGREEQARPWSPTHP